MKWTYFVVLFSVIIVLSTIASTTAASKKKKHKEGSTTAAPTSLAPKSKTKTKTRWSSSTDLGAHSTNSMVATEEHGYYIKRTYLPLEEDANSTQISVSGKRQSPPFLAVPIAWFDCPGPPASCYRPYTALMLNSNSNYNSLQEGFLCDDDCMDPYQPICGKTPTEVAVFYNLCKLNVAKCRTHGYWSEFSYEECQRLYANEVHYAEKKFRSSPFFTESPSDSNSKRPANVSTDTANHNNDTPILIQQISDAQPQVKQQNANDHYKAI